MKNKIIFFLLLFPAFIWGNPLSDFAVYKEKNSFLERYITSDSVRVGVREVENQPMSSNIKTWVDSSKNYLHQNGYEIMEQKKIGDFEYIKTRISFQEKAYIYGLALRFASCSHILLIEFSGEEEAFKLYEKQILNFIEGYKKK